MRVALYARVSTADKDQNPETQLLHLRKICDAHGHTIVAEYVDESSGRTIAGRPQYQAMMVAAAKHSFDAIMAFKLDRFHRNVREQLNMADNLKLLRVDMISTSESIDTTTAMGRMFFVICAALNECESNKTSERVHIGMDRAKAEGKLCHRPRKPLSDYQITKAKKILEENPTISQRRLAAQFEGISRPKLIQGLRDAGIHVGNVIVSDSNKEVFDNKDGGQ